MLLACGILTVSKKGNYKGKLGICSKAWENLRDEFKLKGLMEMEHVTMENLVGTRVLCVRVEKALITGASIARAYAYSIITYQ